ncbi:hypothetical protein TRFO_20376 [Tritrichomonas foetus]|uniref:Uncharacterized protein n=1 Tax=Tritrichomonas foetus TaxID=1144522 RepID=A0A1J4KL30_9EUKA|nr:hypothetical protein TRFO_20376 [Tritrichomonas foetus]|eukprot:OHT10406.1 hypothetical protein TRFO_20376 [Tritrichomonas foetus]
MYVKHLMGDEIFSIRVVGSTELISNLPLENVVVRVSIVQELTGELLKKSKKSDKTFSQYEKSAVIPQCQTRGINCTKLRSLSAIWNETFLFNEPIKSILHSDVAIIFEIIDCTIHKGLSGFHPVAWGFLKTKYQNKEISIVNKKSVLQLFKYPNNFNTSLQTGNSLVLPVVSLLPKKEKTDARLTVEILEKEPMDFAEVERRPASVFEKEVGYKTVDELLDSDYDENNNNNLTNNNIESEARKDMSLDSSRMIGRRCAVPRILCNQIPAGENGALCLRFNHDGSLLAAAVQVDNQYNIQLYARQNNITNSPMQLICTFPAHLDLIHELTFSANDKYLLSVSSDGMAKVWLTDGTTKPKAVLPHSNFIYTGKFHPLEDEIIATAGFEGTIKLWDRKTEKCLTTLSQHKARVNSIVFSPNGKQLFCGDANGCISVWDVDFSEHDPEKTKLQKFVIEGEIKGCCITHLDMGKSNLSLLVHTQDNIVRNFETKVMVPSQRYVGASCSKFRMESSFSPDGSYVIAGSENGSVMLWSVKGSDPVPVIEWNRKFSYPVTTIAWNPTDDMVAFSSFGSGQPILIFVDKPVNLPRKKRIPSRNQSRNFYSSSRSTPKTTP